MNKLITMIAVISFTVISFASAEVRLGTSIAITFFEADGTETMKANGTRTNGGADETVMIPAIFGEVGSSNLGLYVGFDYTDVAALSGKSSSGKTDQTNGTTATGVNNSASADLDSITSIYLLKTLFGTGFYAKLGRSQADIITTETLGTGSTYGNSSTDGMLLGLGYQKDSDGGWFVRASGEYIDYDAVTINSSTTDGVNSSVKADVDSMAYKLSIGKSF